jgi:hypothetical protein
MIVLKRKLIFDMRGAGRELLNASDENIALPRTHGMKAFDEE